MRGLFFGAAIMFIFLPSLLTAHPGKTDRRGGHVCRKDCSAWDLYVGEYHLHDEDGRPLRIEKKIPLKRAGNPEENMSTGNEQRVNPPPPQTERIPALEKAVLPASRPDNPTVQKPGSGDDIYTLNQLWLLLIAAALIFLLVALVIRREKNRRL